MKNMGKKNLVTKCRRERLREGQGGVVLQEVSWASGGGMRSGD